MTKQSKECDFTKKIQKSTFDEIEVSITVETVELSTFGKKVYVSIDLDTGKVSKKLALN